MRSLNDTFACTVFPFTGNTTETRASGMKQMTTLTGLVSLMAVAEGPEGVKVGDRVYVAGKDVRAPWAQNKHKLPDGREFILVPKHAAVLIEALGA